MQRDDYQYYRIRAAERALKTLCLFTVARPQLSLIEIARELKVHKSTAHRTVLTLKNMGFLRWDASTGRYTLGLKLLELGTVVLSTLELRKQARPHLERLQQDTGQTVHLGVLDDGEVIYIDKIEGPGSIKLYSAVGKRVPAHCTAVGKVLLAHLPPSVAKRILMQKGLKRYMPATMVSLPALMAHLEEVRQKGYAVDRLEHEPFVHCVGAPIRDYTGQVVAALSVTVIAAQLSDEEIKRYAALVKEASAQISKDMGFRGERSLPSAAAGNGHEVDLA